MKKFLKRSKCEFHFNLAKALNTFVFCTILYLVTSCLSLKSHGKHEKRWAYTHPIAAIKLNQVKKKCDIVYEEVKANKFLDEYENGGKLDAFRHMFYMAMFANKVAAQKVRKLGVAHEKDNYQLFLKNKNEDGEKADSLSAVMDLLNNELGIELAATIKKQKTPNIIKDLCLNNIQIGNVYFMKRDTIGNYLNCNSEIINLNAYKNVWNIPKCLIQK